MNDLIEKLQKLGLSKRESEIYIALLKKKEFTAPEIGKVTSVSRNKSYEILQSLVKKNLCTEKYKNGTKFFSSVEPNIALQNILSSYEEEFNEKQKLAANYRDELMQLYSANEESSDSLDYVEVLTDLGQIRSRWIELQKNTKHEILGFNKPPFAVSLEQNVSYQKNTTKRKIKEKGIYEFSETPSKEAVKHFISVVQMYLNIGEDVRINESLPMKLMIIDEKITMLALNDPVSLEPSFTTILIEHPNYAKAQKIIFDTFWANSITLEKFKVKMKKYL